MQDYTQWLGKEVVLYGDDSEMYVTGVLVRLKYEYNSHTKEVWTWASITGYGDSFIVDNTLRLAQKI